MLWLPLPFRSRRPLKLPNREFKNRRRLRQRQRHKAGILLVERTKMLVLHVRHALLNISLPYSSPYSSKQLEMTKVKVLSTTWTNYSESFSITLYFKSVRSIPVLNRSFFFFYNRSYQFGYRIFRQFCTK